MDDQILRGHLPLLVLGLIGEEPRHGYGLAREIKRRGGTALRLGEGTLYPLLHRLERQGLIRARWEDGPRGKPRKVYRLCAAGRRRLQSGRNDWNALNRLVAEFLGPEWSAS